MNGFIEERLDAYVDELRAFARIPSVSSQGRGIEAAAQWTLDALRRRGVDARLCATAGNPVVVGSIGSGPHTVLLYNHYDVQPAEPLDMWTSPPFEPELRDGKLFGRGIIDDKGEIVARLAALDALNARYGGALPLRLTFLIEGEEENGSANLEPLLARERDALASDACLWEAGSIDAEGRPQVWIGVRGVLFVELIATALRRDAHSGWAHLLPNAAWRLHAALATLRNDAGNVTIDGFCDDVRGPSARQRELLEALPDELPAFRSEFGFDAAPGGREGYAAREAVFAPTCNLAGVWSGHTGAGTKTVIPAQAHARIDFRLVPDQDPQRCLRALRAHLDARGFGDVAVVSPERGSRAACSDPDHPFIRCAAGVLREQYGKEPLLVPMVGGTGPAADVVHHLGVPFASIGCSYPGGRKHAPDENIRLEDFVRGAAAIAAILERYAREPSIAASTIASR